MGPTNNSAISPGFRPGESLAVKALLFDLDDTLWPIAPVIARSWRHGWNKLRLAAKTVYKCMHKPLACKPGAR